MVERILVEKLQKYDSELREIVLDIKSLYGFNIKDAKRVFKYDVEGVGKSDLDKVKKEVFSSPVSDKVLKNADSLKGLPAIIVEYLDGQYDQRADSAEQCIQALLGGDRPIVKIAVIYIFNGLTDSELEVVKKYLINPVDSREGSLALPKTLKKKHVLKNKMREEFEGFIEMSKTELKKFFDEEGFAMNFEDLSFVQDYFKSVKRNPTVTEIKVIDTYWSDHCRHSTFFTELKNIKIFSSNKNIEKTFKLYQKTFEELYVGRTDKYTCLMDVATIAVKKLRKEGYLDKMEISEEVNACSVNVTLDNNGEKEDWIIMFKNETHNHPTEIEPFGGASTCLGGAIRDPLSGRVYVYQSMRLTGSGNPLETAKETLEGKLPQRFLTKTALAGFTSYGNQIGLTTGQVQELYHDRFRAKRMEAGYVIGGAPKENVVRRSPRVGDVVILLGGETGRDGIGGATGSSRAHSSEAAEESGGPKGNPPEERKIQRLFRDPELSRMIVKSNDFGAGGVCVAIGELSDGVDIYLEKVPTKYEGLTATEIAISESQERMAVVVESKNVETFVKKSKDENLNAVVVAKITDLNRMRMFYKDEVICDIERDFLNTNGVRQIQDVTIKEDETKYFQTIDEDVARDIAVNDYESALCNQISSLENCSRKGISDTFDSTIGASTVILPYGGKRQTTPATIMASKPPVSGFTKTVTCSSYGLYPNLMITSPYVGATYSVIAAISKLIASGVDYNSIYMTFQEYFLRVGKDPVRWGQPLSALLGAFDAQMNLKIGSIGGKDSMSGTYDDIDVPPTLAAFAMGIATDDNIIHNAFGTVGNVFRFSVKKDEFSRPDYESLKKVYKTVEKLIKEGKVLYSAAVEGSTLVTIAKSLLGNMAGMEFSFMDESLFLPTIGDIVLVSNESIIPGAEYLGKLNDLGEITYPNGKISLEKVDNAFQNTLETVFTTKIKETKEEVKDLSFKSTKIWKAISKVSKPKVFMPIFPGTNSEYDMIKSFEAEGAEVETFVVLNAGAEDIDYSIKVMVDKIKKAQILALPGGAITGNEPDGPSKFSSALLSRKEVKEAILDLLYKRDGLAIGIANGFQTLVKLGLIPVDNMAFVPNNRGRHVATMVNVRVSSNNSPWMSSFKVGDIYHLPFSNAYGKLVVSAEEVDKLVANGQITTQYCDESGKATMNYKFNPAGSVYAIDSLISPCGRVIGIMSHVDRWQKGNYQNMVGRFEMNVIANGVKYYK